MGDMLSQDEINALLGDADNEVDGSEAASNEMNILSNEEKDIMGESGNISMGTAATTLFA